MTKDLPPVPPLNPPSVEPVATESSKRPARPWDLFNKNIGRVEDSIKDERMAICRECPFLIKITGQCSKCGCFMEAKTRLPNASCPEGKWDSVEIDPNLLSYND
jgi:hypothetical protein